MIQALDVRRWSFALAACALLGWAGWLIGHRALAATAWRHARSVGEIERGCQADPGNAACWARLAEAREALGEDASFDWRRAIETNPRDGRVLTQAAITAEERGETAYAEKLLLEAEAHNHLWLPRWTLANFYLRANRKDDFWRWMRLAFERSYGDPTAAFRACRRAGGSAAFLLDKVLPPSPEILNAFILFLVDERSFDELPGAAERYAAIAPEAQQRNVTSALMAAADALLLDGRAGPALDLWNHLARRNYIPYGAWSEESPVVNERFQPPLPVPAFDWRAPRQDGVMTIFGAPAEGVKITLTGRQPENTELLSQFVILPPGKRYDFAFDYQTPGIAEAETALHWNIIDASTGEPYVVNPPQLSSPAWTRQSMRVDTPLSDGNRLAKLSLIAGRKLGCPRMQGEVWFRRLRVGAY